MASPLCSSTDSQHESDQSSGDMVSDLCFYGGDEGSDDDFEGSECSSAYQGPSGVARVSSARGPMLGAAPPPPRLVNPASALGGKNRQATTTTTTKKSSARKSRDPGRSGPLKARGP